MKKQPENRREKTYDRVETMEMTTPAVVALGMFDGVHIGHRALIEAAIADAKENRAVPAVYTFANHPMEVLGGGVRLLCSARERGAILRSLGLEEIVSEPFTRELAALSPEAFVEGLLRRWDVRELVVGYNYTFGERGRGTPETLESLGRIKGFGVRVVPPVLFEGEPVSSTRVREAVERGDMPLAEAMLSRKYALSGKVVQNKRIGRRIGFPTANIEADVRRVIPKEGVYATYAYVGGAAYRAVTNIGTNPTVHGEKMSVETHILDFDQDIYGADLTMAFRFFLRGEVAFESLEDMKRQIGEDVLRAGVR